MVDMDSDAAIFKGFYLEALGKKRGCENLHDDHHPSFPSRLANMRHTSPSESKLTYTVCVLNVLKIHMG